MERVALSDHEVSDSASTGTLEGEAMGPSLLKCWNCLQETLLHCAKSDLPMVPEQALWTAYGSVFCCSSSGDEDEGQERNRARPPALRPPPTSILSSRMGLKMRKN